MNLVELPVWGVASNVLTRFCEVSFALHNFEVTLKCHGTVFLGNVCRHFVSVEFSENKFLCEVFFCKKIFPMKFFCPDFFLQ